MHLDAIETVPLTDMALARREVEAKHAHTIPTHLCIVLLSKEFTDFVKRSVYVAGLERGVSPIAFWSTLMRRLI